MARSRRGIYRFVPLFVTGKRCNAIWLQVVSYSPNCNNLLLSVQLNRYIIFLRAWKNYPLYSSEKIRIIPRLFLPILGKPTSVPPPKIVNRIRHLRKKSHDLSLNSDKTISLLSKSSRSKKLSKFLIPGNRTFLSNLRKTICPIYSRLHIITIELKGETYPIPL